MRQKAVTLINRGMNRDMSVSKVDGSSACENRNIRITVRDNDTMLSVTNERGNKEVELGTLIAGELLGWNVLNNHIILFTHDGESTDRIYRIDYEDGTFEPHLLYTGDLGFEMSHPIESIVYHETETIQKIYWVDGIHVLRFMNFMAEDDEIDNWDDYSFDSTIFSDYSINVSISKDYSGVNRPNGVAQYLITYYNKHGQESGYAWVSDLVYMTPRNAGGSADGTNSCKVTLTINFDDNNKFTNFRVYSIFRSSLNQALVAYIVADGEIVHGEPVIVADDGAHLVTEDISRLLYLGSQEVKPYTITHKDQTLFLGGLESTGQDYGWIRKFIDDYDIYNKDTGLINHGPGAAWRWVEFVYEDGPEYNDDSGSYTYNSQLINTSSEILSFKGGEKYRFALSFKLESGATTPAFWIGDAVNQLYPIIDKNGHVIRRVIAKFVIPKDMYAKFDDNKIAAVQLMIAEATYADRSVKAQGILNPTVFNVWERYNDRLYSASSWFSRPRRAGIANSHFSPIENSTSSSGEVQCNYWKTSSSPTPYYRLVGGKIEDELDGVADYDHVMIVYSYKHDKSKGGSNNDIYHYNVIVLKAKGTVPTHTFTQADVDAISRYGNSGYTISPDGIYVVLSYNQKGNYKQAYASISGFLRENGVVDSNLIVSDTALMNWFNEGNSTQRWRVQGSSSSWTTSALEALNKKVWHSVTDDQIVSVDDYVESLYKRHLMFVDENVVTLNSPELEYEAIDLDVINNSDSHYKLRIVGVAKITGGYSDYVVEARHGKASGENLVSASFSSSSGSGNSDGLSAWPLWREFGLQKKEGQDEKDKDKRTSEYYTYGPDLVKYWLYAWNHAGNIDGFSADDGDYSSLISKTFANMRFSGYTLYQNLDYGEHAYKPESVRTFKSLASQYTAIRVGGETRHYDGNPSMSLSLPGTHKYPLLYSIGTQDTNDVLSASEEDNSYLLVNDPVQIRFNSRAHAVISLPTSVNGNSVTQTILPYISSDFTAVENNAVTPWDTKDYHISQSMFDAYFNNGESLSDTDKYLFIGELFYDFTDEGVEDTRYGGISEFAVENNRFIPAGPVIRKGDLEPMRITFSPSSPSILVGYRGIADRGDTYFQRWDCVKTVPSSAAANSANNVIDITSVMLETHINLDGRTDNLRGTKYLASIDQEKYGTLNPVYSQVDNFFSSRQLDEDMDQDVYRSSITWTLDKTDSADIDEWTHITLANSLKLDGDKGSCRAIRRFNNSIIAFQDRAISEILFNSRTQISTTDGVPVEIGNSGKVDGKRYITNKFGCVNKWSIVEGKAALYFVDNINKAFCAFGGQGIQPLSTKLGFDAWFRRINSVEPWAPDETFNNMVAYYDRIHSDVYLVGTGEAYGDIPCLVYNETLGVFTSFFDYSRVPMMANVEDRFVSVRDHKLWLQNEGLYCNFFGTDYGYGIEYRATPDPYGDKIWTNVDYRADYYRLLDDNGESVIPERLMINGEFYDDIAGTYQDSKTFDSLRIWNEYQNTGDVTLGRDYTTDRTTRRKFRIWHVAIPRSVKTDRNKWGLDRIRNPWISLLFSKKASSDNRKDMAQIHDVTVRYFE